MKNLEAYTGRSIGDRLTGCARELFLTCWDYMHRAFGDNVEFELMADLVLLCGKTKDQLYGPPEKTAYLRGSRPILEGVVDRVCQGTATEREKVLALFAYVRDLHLRSGRRDYFYGGTEEEQIKKGDFYCERVSRLMMALCEIAGIPGRMIFHLTTGHQVNEIYVEGSWAYFDPRFGVFFADEKDRFLSVLDLREDPGVIYRQPKWVRDYLNPDDPYDRDLCRDRYLSKKEIQLYGTYSLTQAHRYHYEWMPSAVFPVPDRDEAAKRYADLTERYFGGEYYPDTMLIG